MSVVVSEIFAHANQKKGTDHETGCDFKYNTYQSLKTYGVDNKFCVVGTYQSAMGGTVSTNIDLSVDEAKKLKKQLEEFISQHS